MFTLVSAIPLTMGARVRPAGLNPIAIGSEEAEPEGGIVRIPFASLGAAADTDARLLVGLDREIDLDASAQPGLSADQERAVSISGRAISASVGSEGDAGLPGKASSEPLVECELAALIKSLRM